MSFNIVEIDNEELNVETKSKTLAVDLQGIDVEGILGRDEGLPVLAKKTIEIELVPRTEIRDTEEYRFNLDQNILSQFKDFNIFLDSGLGVELLVYFSTSHAGTGVTRHLVACYEYDDKPPYDLSHRLYGTDEGDINHRIPTNIGIFDLSEIHAKTETGRIALNPSPYKNFVGLNNRFVVAIKAKSVPSSGSVRAYLVGVPN